MVLALSPMRFLLQIAQRWRTSRIFTANEFNIIKNLWTSATLVLKSHDETHSIHSDTPKMHLATGEVRASSKYILPIPLRHPSQWRHQNWIKSNASLFLMPRFYCQLVKLLSIYILFMSGNLSYYMNAFWKFESIVLFNKIRESHLHHAYPVAYQDRKIDDR